MSAKTSSRFIGTAKLIGIVASLAAIAGCCIATAALILAFGQRVFPNMSVRSPTPTELTLFTVTPIPTELTLFTVAPTPTDLTLSTVTPTPNKGPFVISGTISNRKQVQIPSNVRVLVVWMVMTTDPDSGYIFGEGKINLESNTFEIILDKEPPVGALNWVNGNGLGVAQIILTTDQTLDEGIVQASDSDILPNILGWSGQHALLYIEEDLSYLDEIQWIDQFPPGYSVGEGIKIPNSTFDGFRPTDPTDIEIIIDDFENIEFANWS